MNGPFLPPPLVIEEVSGNFRIQSNLLKNKQQVPSPRRFFFIFFKKTKGRMREQELLRIGRILVVDTPIMFLNLNKNDFRPEERQKERERER